MLLLTCVTDVVRTLSEVRDGRLTASNLDVVAGHSRGSASGRTLRAVQVRRRHYSFVRFRARIPCKSTQQPRLYQGVQGRSALGRRWASTGVSGRPDSVCGCMRPARTWCRRANSARSPKHSPTPSQPAGPPAPSRATLYRALERDVSKGQRAGMRGGERARRAHDVFLQRPAGHRNPVWETDHVQAKVNVDIDGRLGRPWVTWFVDCATDVICGFAVTAQVQAGRASLSRSGTRSAARANTAPSGPPTGRARGQSQGLPLPRGRRRTGSVRDTGGGPAPYSPHLKGTVEALNKAVTAPCATLVRHRDHTPPLRPSTPHAVSQA
ncbi:hypothetical protein ABIA38_003444 [Embleya sp. AB8]